VGTLEDRVESLFTAVWPQLTKTLKDDYVDYTSDCGFWRPVVSIRSSEYRMKHLTLCRSREQRD
jgi:hypothetical protein